ncbi:FAD-binding oxidoreductase [Halalkalibacter krulwichiae]|uniref:Putative FAD-linked oxidoreductase n=1 Tax=Halalkalibacter krulwichiae TaxID=199441 RepID=A0A1X9MEY7_9BACI|nr:FAD-binding oxidoreductase [Halalkalibacter krulwichiae]ARK32019.1 putative FAD-linked oxidoreductase [Halalkalibacter krulwichiae]
MDCSTNWLQKVDTEFEKEVINKKEKYVKRMSQDYYWYSPILREQLTDRFGDCVLSPRSEKELIDIIKFAVRYKVPIVVRGGGTGNYGQIVPLKGGIVLDTSRLTNVIYIEKGAGTFQAGVKLGTIERLLKESDQELRFFPSTYLKSTVAGFIAGGTGGIGSIEYGTLWDEGNILSLTILTMEETPRKQLVQSKEELAQYIHSYGISGIILEATLALAPRTNWVDLFVHFTGLDQALLFSEKVANDPIIKKRLVSVCEAPLSAAFRPIETFTNARTATVLLQIDSCHIEKVKQQVENDGGTIAASFSEYIKKHKLRSSDFSWNHVTLWWLNRHPTDTYLQGRFDPRDYLSQVRTLKKVYQDEVLIHFEWIKAGGKVVPNSQPIIRFTTIERLQEIIATFRECGIKVSNPHTYVLEEGGKDDWIDAICDAKMHNDPFDLLNPGKTNRLALAGDQIV